MQPLVDYVVYILPQDSSPWSIAAQIGTVVIAVLALVLSIKQAKQTNAQHERDRLHARLMAKPHLDCQSKVLGQDYLFTISNNGLGPAVIKKIDVYWQKKLQPSYSIEEVLNKKFVLTLSERNFSFNYVEVNGYVPAGVTIEIVRIQTADTLLLPQQVKSVIEKELYITGVYESIFGDSFDFDTRASLETSIATNPS